MWRVSSREQSEGFSIDAQRREGLRYAEKHGIEIVKEFEAAESAKRDGRKVYAEVLAFVREHPDVNILLVEKPDRLSRNFREYSKASDLVEELGKEIHLFRVGRVLTQESPASDWFATDIDISVGLFGSRNLSQEVRKGMKEKAEQGLWPSAAPFGYINNRTTKSIDPDPNRAPIFIRLAETYSGGHCSLKAIQDLAFKEGLLSRKGNKITRNSLWLYFQNLVYTGDFVWDGKRYQGTYQPLWSLELHDALLKALKRDGKGHRVAWRQKEGIAFRGMGLCTWPGCPDVGRRVLTGDGPKKGNPDLVYYHCTIHSTPSIRQDILAEKLGEKLKDLVIPADIVEWVRTELQRGHDQEKKRIESKITLLNNRYKQLQRWAALCYEDKLEDRVSVDEWKTKTNAWRAEQAKIEVELAGTRVDNQDFIEDGVRLLELAQRAHSLYLAANPQEKRELLEIVFQNFEFDGVTVSPTWAKPFDTLVSTAETHDWLGR